MSRKRSPPIRRLGPLPKVSKLSPKRP
jgi:hypothetical protein